MKKLTFTNTAVFVLFFGMAVIEAVQTKNWLKVIFWLAIGLVFLIAGCYVFSDLHLKWSKEDGF